MNSKGLATIEKLEVAIRETVKEFQAYPADFLSENDIQSLLFTELRREMKEMRYKPVASQVDKRFGNVPAIHPVKSEYQLFPKGSGDRCDIAVLSEEEQDPESNLWRQPCRIAIEIKFWQAGERYTGSYLKDFEKLLRYLQESQSKNHQFTGIVMLFVHPGAKNLPKKYTTGIKPDYPCAGVSFHLVTPEVWYKVPYSVIAE
jgi:hypothetical protein